jgi:hypothetical protein
MKKLGRNEPCHCGSGRKLKHCCRIGPEPSIPMGADLDNEAFRTVFLGEGAVPLTDDVIADLVRKGWPEGNLREAQAAGAAYNTLRNSIVYPAEYDGDMFN